MSERQRCRKREEKMKSELWEKREEEATKTERKMRKKMVGEKD